MIRFFMAATVLLAAAGWVPPGPAQGKTLTVLVLGDSLTAGYGVLPEQAFPALIEAGLAARGLDQVKVINAGVSGATSAGAMARLKWHLRAGPRVVVLALGANDGLRGLPVPEMEKNLEEAVALAKSSGLKVIIAGMEAPPNLGPEYAGAFRKVFSNLASRHKAILIPFLLEGVAGKPGLNQADGIHPNALGHEIMAGTVLPYILEAL